MKRFNNTYCNFWSSFKDEQETLYVKSKTGI